jgi:hypothetical protein
MNNKKKKKRKVNNLNKDDPLLLKVSTKKKKASLCLLFMNSDERCDNRVERKSVMMMGKRLFELYVFLPPLNAVFS